MNTSVTDRNFALMSTRRSANELEVAVREVKMPHAVDQDDIVVKMLAAPINPSDIGLMLSPADPDTARRADTDAQDVLARTVLRVPGAPDVDPATLGVARPVGLEGTGQVVAAGTDPTPRHCSGER